MFGYIHSWIDRLKRDSVGESETTLPRKVFLSCGLTCCKWHRNLVFLFHFRLGSWPGCGMTAACSYFILSYGTT